MGEGGLKRAGASGEVLPVTSHLSNSALMPRNALNSLAELQRSIQVPCEGDYINLPCNCSVACLFLIIVPY